MTTSHIYNQNLIKIKIPESSYVLGLMWADGHIYTHTTCDSKVLRIDLIEKDAKIILPILKKIGQWNAHSIKRKRSSPSIMMSCSDKQTCNFLIKQDYKSKDNSADKILSKIPKSLHNYFFRGLFDGDGCLHITKQKRGQLEISGPHTQNWKYVEKLFQELNIKYSICRTVNKKTGHKRSQIKIFRQTDILKLKNYLYKGKLFGLNRKYKKFKEVEKAFNQSKQRIRRLEIADIK